MLFSTTLRDYAGLDKPYEQWMFEGTIVGFVWKGLPALKRGYFAFQYVRTPSTDTAAKTRLLKRLEVEGSPESLMHAMKHLKSKAVLWGLVPIGCMSYIANARRIRKILAVKAAKDA